MAVALLQGVPVEETTPERLKRDGFCPLCACLLNPGEKICLDCILDVSIAGTE
ncbi:MAG: hypothetical protein IBX71_10045 [Candidatus Desulforudis sp.]|nr:hypothetical protein [Desulforudis sp.]